MSAEKVRLRRTRESDLVDTLRLVIRTVNHLFVRVGKKRFKYRVTGPSPLSIHFLKTDPEGCFVAVNEKDRVIGVAESMIRDEEWYLGHLFVTPRYQSKGIGGKLLDKALRYGMKNGCKRFSLVTFAFNEQAIAVYTKRNMPPQRPILTMTRNLGDCGRRLHLKPAIKLECRETTDDTMIVRLTELDKKARGIRRPEEHFFWLNDSSHQVLTFYHGSKLVGYSVIVNKGQRVSPVAATAPRYLQPITAASVNFAADLNPQHQSLWIYGEQQHVLTDLLAAKFRVTETLLLMSSEMVTEPSLYVPANLSHL